MVKAWYYKESDEDQGTPHQHDPPTIRQCGGADGQNWHHLLEGKVQVSLRDNTTNLDAIFWFIQLNADLGDSDIHFQVIKKKRGYGYQEIIEVSPSKLPNYDQQLKNFFTEHLHDHEEIRFILKGSGYWDVRDHDHDGKWIRFEIEKGDMLALPSGMYHRFTLDTGNYIKAIALHIGVPSRIQYSRSHFADQMECRRKYVQTYLTTDQLTGQAGKLEAER